MKRHFIKKTGAAVAPILLLFSVVLLSGASFARQDAGDPGWPRLFKSGGDEVVVYQPQLEGWDNHEKLYGKAAVVVKLKGQEQEYYGALDLETVTETDFESRTVLLKDFKITGDIFPNIPENRARICSRAVRDALPEGKTLVISMDRILAGLEGTREKARGVALNLEPPPIYRSEQPAILVLFMGEPEFKGVEGVRGRR